MATDPNNPWVGPPGSPPGTKSWAPSWLGKAMDPRVHGPIVAGVAVGGFTGNPMLGFAVYNGMKYAVSQMGADGKPLPGAQPIGPAGAVPQMDPNAFNAPANQFLGTAYEHTPEYQQQAAALQDISTQIAQLQAQNNPNLAAVYPDKAALLTQQIQQLQAQRQTMHDQLAQSVTANNSQRDTSYLSGLAQGQGDLTAPEAQFQEYGGGSRNLAMGARGYQDEQLARLRADMSGETPSLAQLQLEQGGRTTMNNALSLAASQRGGGGSLGTIEALRSNAGTMANVNQQAAMLRAQEYQNAEQQFGGVAGQMRGQDTSMMGMDYQNALAQAQLQAQTNQLNTQNRQFNMQAYLAEQARRQAALQDYQRQQANNAIQVYGIDKNTGLGAAQLAQQNAQYNQNRSDSQLKSFVGAVSTGLSASSTGKGGGTTAEPGGYAKPDYTDPGYDQKIGV